MVMLEFTRKRGSDVGGGFFGGGWQLECHICVKGQGVHGRPAARGENPHQMTMTLCF